MHARALRTPRMSGALLFAVLMQLCLPGPDRAQATEIVVFAAASTSDALADIAPVFTAETKIKVVASFAASSTLAKQIESGAPADLFISADEKWMDYLAARDLIQADSRIALLGNRIVLIAPAESRLPEAALTPGTPLQEWLRGGRLAIGDPLHVPAGLYGRQALESLDLWVQVEAHLAPTKDVRAALALVERAETPLGLVYATDAAISGKVRVIGSFPASSHPPIIYPAALVAGANPAAGAFLSFLQSARAKSLFETHGFTAR